MRWALFGAAIISLSIASAQTSVTVPAQFLSSRPLSDAANLLGRLYGKAITYEEPVLVWNGNLETFRGNNPDAKGVLIPKPYGFPLPAGVGTDPNIASLLQKMIASNNAQPNVPHYRLLTSKFGFHIVPMQFNNVNGSAVEAQSILDVPINIPVANRTPTQHIRLFLAAIENASGIPVSWGTLGLQQGLDYEFLGRFQGSLEWGASGVSGRDALIDLFDRSATTYLWFLWCQPQNPVCSLNVRKIEVAVTDPQGKPATKVSRFDRCTDCPSEDVLPLPPNR